MKLKRTSREIDFTSRSCCGLLERAPSTIDDDSMTVEVVMATEEPAVMWDAKYGEVDEILLISGVLHADHVPLLDAHNRSSVDNVYGSVSKIHDSEDKLIGLVGFDMSDERAKNAFSKVRSGHVTDFSVGYSVNLVRYAKPGEEITVDGKAYKAGEKRPLRLAIEWTLKELSVVPIGADPNAKARAEIEEPEGERTNCFVEERMEEENIMADEEKKKEETVPAAAPVTKESAPVVDEAAIRADAVLAERARELAIRSEADGIDIDPEVVNTLIRDGKTVEEARSVYLKHVRDARANFAIDVRKEESREDEERKIAAAFLIRSGNEEFASEEYGDEIVSGARAFREMDTIELCRWALQHEGQQVPMGRIGVVERAFSTTTLPKTLGAIANKSALRGYTLMTPTWKQLANIVEVANFQTQTAIRTSMTEDLEKVGSGGEIEHGKMAEEYEQYSIDTYAKMFAVTRQQMINDDMNAFTEIPQQHGVMAERKESNLFYTHLMANGTLVDTYALCGTDHSNYLSGTATALSASNAVAALDAAVATFMKQTDKSGNPLGVMPAFLLVPPELATVAQSVYGSEMIVSGNTARTPNKNVFQGKFIVVAEPRLSTSTYTNYSTKAWYLLANPLESEVMRVAYLRGQRGPVVERADASFDTLGTQFRVYLDFGVKAVDYRGIFKSKGEA